VPPIAGVNRPSNQRQLGMIDCLLAWTGWRLAGGRSQDFEVTATAQ
jgi:hypothetical protein